MSTIVYQYGLKPPFENAELVHDQLGRAHRYRNTLVEIERTRREMVRALIDEDPDVIAATACARTGAKLAADAAIEVKALRAASRERAVDPAIVALAKAARDAEYDALRMLASARSAAMKEPARAAAILEFGERAKELHRAARAINGVYWGTYLLVEDQVAAAAKTPLWDGLEPTGPHFERFEGTGRLGVQIQISKPLSGADITGNDRRLRIEPLSDAYKQSDHPDGSKRAARVGKRGDQRRVLAIRIGSDDRAAVWARWRVTVHREIPAAAQIKYAVVVRRRVGPRWEWALLITLDTTAVAKPVRADTGVVAIDVGWRKIGEEIRVASWRNDRGEHGELRLPAKMLSSLRYAETLQTLRSDSFDVIRAKLVHWLAAAPSVPAWLAERTATLAQWRSQARLAGVILEWSKKRFEGDEAIYLQLAGVAHEDGGWRYHDHHMWEFECAQRRHSRAERLEFYRMFAAKLARENRTLVLEDFDLKKIARRPTTTEKGDNDNARSNKQLVATGELRGVLMNAFRSRGGDAVTVHTAHTTHDCSVCGCRNEWDQALELRHACVSCGAEWDQDENATRNLLGNYFERPDDAIQAGTARKPRKPRGNAIAGESRWARAKRLGLENKARMETARNEASNKAV